MLISKTLAPLLMVTSLGALSACVPPLPPGHEPPSQTRENLSNEGTLCLIGQANDSIKVYYLPLDTTCASSSQHHWDNARLTAVLMPQGGKNAINVESFVTHVNNHSPMATADCAGAGVQTAQVATNRFRGFDVFWGNRKIGRLASGDGAILCRKVDANGQVTPMPQLHDEIRSMVQMDSFMGR